MTTGHIHQRKNIPQMPTKLVGVAGAYPAATQNGFLVAPTVDEFGNQWVRMAPALAGNLQNQNTPAVNTTASTTLAPVNANASVVVQTVSATLSAVAAIAAPIAVQIKNGASVLWSQNMGPLAAGTSQLLNQSGLNVTGPAGATLTITFSAAPGATNFESIAATGISTGP